MKKRYQRITAAQIRSAMNMCFTTDMSFRKVADATGMSRNTVKKYYHRLLDEKRTYSYIETLTDTELLELLIRTSGKITALVMPDYAMVHESMQQKHVTLQLLHEEYEKANPGFAYSYSQFTHYYREYVNSIDVAMRQSHPAGECVFVDFAGTKIPYIDERSGEKCEAQVFIGVLGCSRYTFVYAVRSQSTEDWIDAHNKMYAFFGGVPKLVVPDNLKAAVIRPGSEPVLNRTYLEQSKHNGIFVIPARIYHAQDKALGESGVKYSSQWITARLRNWTFFSIDEINRAIIELLKRLNERPFKELPGCRRTRFEEFDKPLLRQLPDKPYEYGKWLSARKVRRDYHLLVDGHHYSVPHELVGKDVEVCYTKDCVEIFNKGQRVATHPRSYVDGGTTTNPAHQTQAHRAYAELTPDNLLAWAKTIGPASLAAIQYQFDSRPHAQLGIRACGSLKRLAKDYGHERFEAACRRAELIGSLTVKSIRSILQRRLAEFPETELPIQMNLPLHNNVRGASYYMSREG